jgi:neutral ceramidase
MKKLFFLIFLIFGLSPQVPAAPDGLFMGASKAEITPPSGTPLAGYGRHRGKPTAGVHDPLFARALALSQNGQTFVFISVDLVLIDEELRDAVLKKIKSQASLEDPQLIFFATHTHTGSGAIGGRFWERFIMGKFRKKVFEEITGKIAGAALEALRHKTPVTAESSETGIESLIENRMDEKLELPARLKVLRFKNENGRIAGTLVFMAAHPTLAPAAQFLFSADYPGVLTDRLEKDHAGSVALFVNGAAADLRPKAGFHEDRFENLKDYGLLLAQKVNQMTFSPVSLEGPWKSTVQKIRLPKSRIRLGWLKVPSFIGNRVFPNRTYFQAIRLGKLLFITFPGEASAEVGLEIENAARARYFSPYFVGYAHDFIGYMVPRRYYRDRSQYEATTSFYGEKLEWFYQEQAGRLMDSLMTEDEKKTAAPPAKLGRHEGIPVLTASGNPYHVGFEEGRLLSQEIRQGTDEIFAYFRSELPVPLLNRLMINTLANRAWKKMEPYLTYAEFEQMRGLAEGSGVSFKRIKQIHAMPEIYPTLCANGAYWGRATADGRMIALRNLDWNRQMGIQNRAAVKWIRVPGRESYANIGYYGFAGVLSGLNENGISVGQIGAASSNETMEGTPMPFMLKRVLENASSLAEAVRVFKMYPRTRGYNYVLTDAKAKEAVVLEATKDHLAIFWDEDAREKESPYALILENALFRGDPALDPQVRDLQLASKGNPKKKGLEMPAGSAYEIRYRKQGELAQSHYGKITVETAQEMAREIAPGSNIQSVVYAYPDFWVANAKGDLKAAESGYVRFNAEELDQN